MADTKNSSVESRTIEESIKVREGKIEALDKQAAEARAMVESVAALPADNKARVKLEADAAAILDKIEAERRLLGRDRSVLKVAGLISPVLAKIGSVKVSSAENVKGNVHVVDLDKAISDATIKASKAADALAILNATKRAIAGANLADEIVADFPSIRFVADESKPGTVKAEISSSAGGPRKASAPVVITGYTGAPDVLKVDAATLTGKRVRGEGADFASWKALNDATFTDAALKAKRVSSNDKALSRSERVIAEEYGITSDEITTIGDESDAEDE